MPTIAKPRRIFVRQRRSLTLPPALLGASLLASLFLAALAAAGLLQMSDSFARDAAPAKVAQH